MLYVIMIVYYLLLLLLLKCVFCMLAMVNIVPVRLLTILVGKDVMEYCSLHASWSM